MSSDAEITAVSRQSSALEDFGRFNPVETLDADVEITDEGLDELYTEENGGA